MGSTKRNWSIFHLGTRGLCLTFQGLSEFHLTYFGMGINKKKLAGCLQSILVLFGWLILAGIFWLFRKPISEYFFGHSEYGSLIGLMIVVVIPFLGYILYFVFRNNR